MVSMLTVDNLTAGYDEADVVSNVSLNVIEGKITCLLGANGAGKTTLIRAILGLNNIRAGLVTFSDKDISSWPYFYSKSSGMFSSISISRPLR